MTLVLLAAGLLLSLICAVAGMFASTREYNNPLVEFLLPIFLGPENLRKSLPIVLV